MGIYAANLCGRFYVLDSGTPVPLGYHVRNTVRCIVYTVESALSLQSVLRRSTTNVATLLSQFSVCTGTRLVCEVTGVTCLIKREQLAVRCLHIASKPEVEPAITWGPNASSRQPPTAASIMLCVFIRVNFPSPN